MFVQIRGHRVLVQEHLNVWVTPMSEECFEALIDQILPEGGLNVTAATGARLLIAHLEPPFPVPSPRSLKAPN